MSPASEDHYLECRMVSFTTSPTIKYCLVGLTAAIAFCTNAARADEPPEPPVSKAPAEVQPKEEPAAAPSPLAGLSAEELVEKLGAADFETRRHATDDLGRMGYQAQQALLAGLKHKDPEVRRASRRILGDVLEEDFQIRLQAFIVDTKQEHTHDLPGWQRYKTMVGDDKHARALFADMLTEERGLMASAAAGPGAAANAFRTRFRSIYQKMNSRDSRLKQQPSAASVAAMMFVCSDQDLKLPPELIANSYWSSLLVTKDLAAKIKSGDLSEPLKKITGKWMLREFGTAMLQRKLIFAQQHKIKEGLEYAQIAVREKKTHANYRAYCIHAVGLIGGLDYASFFVSLLDDTTMCTQRVVKVNGKNETVQIQLRDVAIGWLIHLTGQKLEDYGMSRAKTAFDRVKKSPQSSISASYFSFEGNAARDQALKKWKEWVAKNKLPTPPAQIAKLRAEAAQRLADAPKQGAKAFNILGVFGMNNADGDAKDDDGKNDLNRADRPLVRSLKLAQQRIDEGEFSTATLALGQILELEDDYSFRPQRTVPLSRGLKAAASRILDDLPPEGQAEYERHFGAQAESSLRKAIRNRDFENVLQTSRNYFHTRAGAEAAYLAGCHFLDHGHLSRAAVYFERIKRSRRDLVRFEPGLSVKLASCWALAGEADRAEAVLLDLKARTPAATIRIGSRRLPLFQEPTQALNWLATITGPLNARRKGGWPMFRGAADRNAATAQAGPYLQPLRLAVASGDEHIRRHISTIEADLIQQHRSLDPSYSPLIVGDTLVFRTPARTTAVDLQTNKTLWYSEHYDSLRHLIDHGKPESKEKLSTALRDALSRRVWGDHTFGRMSSDGERLYVVDDLAFPLNSESERLVVTPSGKQRLDSGIENAHNRLTAYDLKTGKVLWEQGGPATGAGDPLAGVFFLGPPLPVGNRLYAVGMTENETRLVELHASDGTVDWELGLDRMKPQIPFYLLVYFPPWALEDPARRSGASPSAGDGVMVCPVSSKDFAAIDLTTRSVLWTFQTEQEVETYNPRLGNFWQQQLNEKMKNRGRHRWSDNSVTIADGRAILTPAGSEKMYCVDLRDGGVQWTASRRDGIYIAGVVDGTVVIVGRAGIWGLKLADGAPAWAASTSRLPGGATPSGRGYLSGSTCFIPLSTGEVAGFDVKTGSFTSRTRGREKFTPGNLVAAGGVVISQSAGEVNRFETLDGVISELNTRLAANKNDHAARLKLAELMLFRGDLRNAVAQLKLLVDTAESARATALLGEAFVEGIRSDFAWFKELATEIKAPAVTTPDGLKFHRNLAEAYAAAGQPEQAFDTFLKVLVHETSEAGLEHVASLQQTRRDRWMAAQLHDLIESSPAESQAAMRQRIEALAAEHDTQGLTTATTVLGSGGFQLGQAKKLAGAKSLLAAEQVLVRVARTNDGKIQREAYARLAALLDTAGRLDASARYYRHIANHWPEQICLDGKTGQQLVAEIKNTEIRARIEKSSVWEQGAVDSKHETKTTSLNYMYPIHIVRQGDVHEPQVQLEVDSSGAKLYVFDLAGRSRGAVTLPAAYSGWRYNSTVYSYAQGRLSGHVLMLWIGDRVCAVDLLADAPKVLWHHQTITTTQVYPGITSTPPAWMRTIRNYEAPIVSQFTPVAHTGDAVVFQHRNELWSVDMLTGKKFWTTELSAEFCDIFADRDQVYVSQRDATDARAFHAIDGRQVEGVEIARREDRLAVNGSYLNTWKSTEDGATMAYTRLGQPDKSLWEREFAVNARAYALSAARIAVMLPDGKLEILDAATGKTIQTTALPRQPGFDGVLVWPTIQGYLVLVNSSNLQPPNPGNPFAMQSNIMGSIRANGYVAGVAAGSGELLWVQKVDSQTIRPTIPLDAPVLTCLTMLRQQIKTSWRTNYNLLMIDRRNGKALHDHNSTSSNNVFSFNADVANQTFTVRSRRTTHTYTFKPKDAE